MDCAYPFPVIPEVPGLTANSSVIALQSTRAVTPSHQLERVIRTSDKLEGIGDLWHKQLGLADIEFFIN